jgi:Lon protease-like protein
MTPDVGPEEAAALVSPQPIGLFPLPNVVLFPEMQLPVHVFEPRYRALVADVEAGRCGLGIVLCKDYNPKTLEGVPYEVGTQAILAHLQLLWDGRYNALLQGQGRFRILESTLTQAGYWLADVAPVADTPDSAPSSSLVKQTGHLFQEVLRLVQKLEGGKKSDVPPGAHTAATVESNPVQEALATMPLNAPEALSFFIAQHLKGSLVRKQELLTLTSTRERLRREYDLLKEVVKTLAAQAQIEEAFRP